MGSSTFATSAGGGRIIPGTGGNGGNWDRQSSTVSTVWNGGGSGGSAGNPGGDATLPDPIPGINDYYFGSGGGGGWGARGGYGCHRYRVGNPATTYTTPVISTYTGNGGKAVQLNGYSVTWSGNFSTQFSTRVLGAVS